MNFEEGGKEKRKKFEFSRENDFFLVRLIELYDVSRRFAR